MQTTDSLTTYRAIEIYYEKHHALRHGDLVTLISLKKQYPSMFEKEKDAQIRDIILQAKAFEKTEDYQTLKRTALKDELTTVNADPDKK
tara:strand:+ start:134 stop:400 length:267 start_codon:yes stop_codon:yes gene_type:complete